MAAARRRIRELEAKLAVHRRATELLKEAGWPQRRFAAIEVMVADRLPAQLACRVLEVSESGFYAWRIRAPLLRALRHARVERDFARDQPDRLWVVDSQGPPPLRQGRL